MGCGELLPLIRVRRVLPSSLFILDPLWRSQYRCSVLYAEGTGNVLSRRPVNDEQPPPYIPPINRQLPPPSLSSGVLRSRYICSRRISLGGVYRLGFACVKSWGVNPKSDESAFMDIG